MDCNDARLLLAFARPSSSELERAEVEALQHHLETCPNCSQIANSQQAIEHALGRAMVAIPVPEGLPLRLMARLDAARDCWYRRFALRLGAVAAALILLFGSAGYALMSYRIAIDPMAIRNEVDQQQQAHAEDIEKWLHQVAGDHLSAPEFRYTFITGYGLAPLPGHHRLVPTLEFQRAEGDGRSYFARVYVLGDTIFDLEKFKNQSSHGSGFPGVKYEVRTHSSNPHVLFLVLYTGELEPFLKLPGQNGI